MKTLHSFEDTIPIFAWREGRKCHSGQPTAWPHFKLDTVQMKKKTNWMLLSIFIELVIGSTCYRHHYAHRQEL
jgi:hypothetical protein